MTLLIFVRLPVADRHLPSASTVSQEPIEWAMTVIRSTAGWRQRGGAVLQRVAGIVGAFLVVIIVEDAAARRPGEDDRGDVSMPNRGRSARAVDRILIAIVEAWTKISTRRLFGIWPFSQTRTRHSPSNGSTDTVTKSRAVSRQFLGKEHCQRDDDPEGSGCEPYGRSAGRLIEEGDCPPGSKAQDGERGHGAHDGAEQVKAGTFLLPGHCAPAIARGGALMFRGCRSAVIVETPVCEQQAHARFSSSMTPYFEFPLFFGSQN